MGRPPLNLDKTVIRLSAETRKRIEALEGKRGMAAFIRDAVERELTRREKAVRPKPRK
jgi:predicted DNA-binding protein